MSHSALFARLRRSIRTAFFSEQEQLTTESALARREEAAQAALGSRRQFLGGVGVLAATGAVGALASACGVEGGLEHGTGTSDALTNGVGSLDVAIVGAGLAGLTCASELLKNGVVASVYEANTRVGGRQFSDTTTFPGQSVELGGELIDTSQKNIINYARAFGLTLENYLKAPGDVFYFIDGRQVPEAQVINDFRAFVPAMQDDLRQCSAAPTADAHNDYDKLIDAMSIREYLTARGASDLLIKVVAASYTGEYGREIDDQSALNFIMYIRADRRAKFEPFGTSDQRYHIVEGNDGVARGLAAGLQAGQLKFNKALKRVRKTATGLELTFADGTVKTHAIVVLAMPFTMMRADTADRIGGADAATRITLDASLGLPSWKQDVINNLGYAMCSKNMVGFNGRAWAAQGSDGMLYANLPNIQNAWETDWTNANDSRAVMTNFTGGNLGLAQDPSKSASQTAAFVSDLARVFPAVSPNGKQRMQAWPREKWARGAYTCYRKGHFTSIGGNEGKPVGNLYFAGEHCDSYYDQQGFMEGAIINGQDNAAAILAAAKKA
ncbi:MAG: FAD-dependent oxidoreductase [Deltaproteobacteria bacterium]|nr:FAD-dependent oxidoreductase [Deltaproteobacteria bacterium]